MDLESYILHDRSAKSIVCKGGAPHPIEIYFAPGKIPSIIKVTVFLEDGTNRDLDYQIVEEQKLTTHSLLTIQILGQLPLGRHHLSILTSDHEIRSEMICH
jgi:hypothetical protein